MHTQGIVCTNVEKFDANIANFGGRRVAWRSYRHDIEDDSDPKTIRFGEKGPNLNRKCRHAA